MGIPEFFINAITKLLKYKNWACLKYVMLTHYVTHKYVAQFDNLQTITKTVAKTVKGCHCPFCTCHYYTTSNIKTLHIFRHVGNKMYNLHTRLVTFADLKKKV